MNGLEHDSKKMIEDYLSSLKGMDLAEKEEISKSVVVSDFGNH